MVKFLLGTLIIGLVGCEQVNLPNAERQLNLGNTEKVKQEFFIEDPAAIGLSSLTNEESLSVFSLMSSSENCKFIYSNYLLSGEVSQGGKLIALYPYSEAATMEIEGGQMVVSTMVQAKQDFIETSNPSEDITFFEREVTDGEQCMLSDIAIGINSGRGFNFKSIYGKIILPLRAVGQDVTIKKIEVLGVNGEKISGDVKILVSEELSPRVIAASNTSVMYDGEVNIPKNETKYIIFNIIPQTFFNGLTITLTKSDNIAVEKVYETPITVSVNETLLLSEVIFETLVKDYYIKYIAEQKVIIEGYDCEEYDAETRTGKIYFDKPEIPENLLLNNDVIETIVISSKITKVGNGAFRGLKTKLKSVSVEKGSELTTIGTMAFQACQVCSFDFSNATKLKHIGDTAFGECYSIMKYDFPGSVETIGLGAFRNLRWTDVIIKEGVTTLGTVNGNQGFLQGCKKIERLELPSTLVNVEKNGLKIEHTSDGPTYILICNATVPPTINTEGQFLSANNNKVKLVAIYVPEGSVDNYKGANGWKNWSDRIKSISELEN